MRILMMLFAVICLQNVGVGQIIPPPTINEEDVVYTCDGVSDAIDRCVSANEWIIDNNRSIREGITEWENALAIAVATQIMYINAGQPTPQNIIDNINNIRQRLKDMEKQIQANNLAIHNNYQLRVKLSEWYYEHCVGTPNPVPIPSPDN